MIFEYHEDDDTGLPHIYGHGVREEEAEDILYRLGTHDVYTRKAADGKRSAYGQTEEGRYLKVIFALKRDPVRIKVITAMEMDGKILRFYKRRMR